ncbi:MAG: PAS domain S-box protein [Phycisphaerae bacterium]
MPVATRSALIVLLALGSSITNTADAATPLPMTCTAASTRDVALQGAPLTLAGLAATSSAATRRAAPAAAPNDASRAGLLQRNCDVAIALALLALGPALVGAMRRRGLDAPPAVWLLALLAGATGVVQFVDAVAASSAASRFSDGAKALVAATVWAVVLALLYAVPRARALPTLERANELLRREQHERVRALQCCDTQLTRFADAVSHAAVFTLDRDGAVATWNAGAQRLLGYASDEIVGRHLATFVAPDDRSLTPQHALDHARAHESAAVDAWLTHRDETRFRARVIVAPLTTEPGETSGYTAIACDLTAPHRPDEHPRLLLDAAPEALVVARNSGEIVYANLRAARLFGHAPDALPGMPLAALLPHCERGARLAAQAAAQVFASPAGQHAVRSDGVAFLVEVRTEGVRTEDGTLVIHSIRDQNPRARADEKLRALLEAAPDALVIVDGRGRIVFVNSQTESIFRYRRDELLGQTVELLVPERFRRRHELDRNDYQRAPRTRPIGSGRVLFARRKDGSEFPAEISLSPLQLDDDSLTISAIRDITERCHQEERLRQIEQLNAQLVEGRTVLAESNRSLQMANRELESFSSIASHDLQEPLRKLVGFSHLLRTDLGTALPERAEQDLAFITDAARRMQSLIQDLLRLSRAGSGAMRTARVELEECTRCAIDALHVRIAETRATIDRDPLPSVQGDATLLTQLYQNLIANALKFHRRDDPPQIRLTAERNAGGEFVFGVRDNGIGIAPEHADSIFAPFRRLHGRDEYEGSGIGLAICRKVVARHGGRIWVESEPGRGAHFRFTIPMPQESTQWSEAPTEPASSKKP